MNGPDFVDTNVLVYAYVFDDPRKQRAAQDLVERAMIERFVVSTQVLSELASTLLHKASPRATPAAVIAILDKLAPFRLIVPDAGLVRRAVEACASYGIHFYDGMIVAAAERAGSQRIWSEDLNAGQEYFGAVVENPFR
ncbi:MAG TPA: PIN domain-containing protein [Terriglobales bacterium]|nr:PIN domain-containing protein [Terriglobales bacterium]